MINKPQKEKRTQETPHQVTGEDDSGAMLHKILDSRHSGPNTGIIGDVEAVIKRHIEIHSDEYPIALQIAAPEIPNAPLRRHFHRPRDQD